MLDALVGAVIVAMATSALVLAVEVAERSMNNAGRQPLSSDERQLLQRAKRGDEQALRELEAFLRDMPRQ